jgi:hypothetical protein
MLSDWTAADLWAPSLRITQSRQTFVRAPTGQRDESVRNFDSDYNTNVAPMKQRLNGRPMRRSEVSRAYGVTPSEADETDRLPPCQ